MVENTGRKKWQHPQLIQLGKLSDIEKNDRINEEMKQYLISLRDTGFAHVVKGESLKKPE